MQFSRSLRHRAGTRWRMPRRGAAARRRQPRAFDLSDDPETARQIAELSRDTRPLLVLDVDDVLLEFVRPFTRFLDAQGLALGLTSFRLHGNITDKASGAAIGGCARQRADRPFFNVQARWQTAVEGAAEALQRILPASAEIVLLTAMPHRHRASAPQPSGRARLALSAADDRDRQGPGHPPAARRDGPRRWPSSTTCRATCCRCRRRSSDAHLFHLMADALLRDLLPPVPEGIDRRRGLERGGAENRGRARYLTVPVRARSRMSGRPAFRSMTVSNPARSKTAADPTKRLTEPDLCAWRIGQASRRRAPAPRAKAMPSLNRPCVRPLPRAAERMKKQEIAQTAGSAASAASSGPRPAPHCSIRARRRAGRSASSRPPAHR